MKSTNSVNQEVQDVRTSHKRVKAATYKIIRNFKGDYRSEVVGKGLSLEEARRYCHGRETSSFTCVGREGKELTAKCGDWFDCYAEE